MLGVPSARRDMRGISAKHGRPSDSADVVAAAERAVGQLAQIDQQQAEQHARTRRRRHPAARCAESSVGPAAAPARSRARRALRSRLLRGLLDALQHRLQQAARCLGVALHRVQRDLRLRHRARSVPVLAQVLLQVRSRVRGRRAHPPRWPRQHGRSPRRSAIHFGDLAAQACTSGWLAPSRPSIDCNSAVNWSCRTRSCTTDGAIAACAVAPARPLAASSLPSAAARSLRARARFSASRLICSLSSRACMPSTRPCSAR